MIIPAIAAFAVLASYLLLSEYGRTKAAANEALEKQQIKQVRCNRCFIWHIVLKDENPLYCPDCERLVKNWTEFRAEHFNG